MEKSEPYRDMKMTRRFHPACPVPPPGEVTLVWCPLCSEIQRFGGLAPLCLLAVVETGEVAASGGGSLLPGLAPSGQGHVHTHTPWAAWSITAPTHPHGCGLSPHGRSPEHLRRWWRGSVAVAQLMLLLRIPIPGRHTRSLCFFQAGEKHYHPLCALCVRCGRMFAEGEEMYLQGKMRSVPSGARGARQALGDRALSRARRRLSELSRWLGSPASQWGRGSGPAGSPHRDPIQEQDPGLVDVWVPVACGLWLLQARPERPLAQGGVGRQVSGFPTTPPLPLQADEGVWRPRAAPEASFPARGVAKAPVKKALEEGMANLLTHSVGNPGPIHHSNHSDRRIKASCGPRPGGTAGHGQSSLPSFCRGPSS